jgi:hypothetical protein
MGKNFISIFLFLLFCIVIAFPGYGRSTPMKQNGKQTSAQIKNTETKKITFKTLIKKCLAKGISIVEEERPVEENQTETEDEVNPGLEEETLYLEFTLSLQHPLVWNVPFYNTDNNYQTVALRGVPNPPPECVLN